jgi:hypothetical protein
MTACMIEINENENKKFGNLLTYYLVGRCNKILMWASQYYNTFCK